jgi:mannose-6-phosphate isomerase-like protein (cupin superfamily)
MKHQKPTIVSIQKPPAGKAGFHYTWGDGCDGWNFVEAAGLSVKLERMPPHTAEREHFHERALQFFFILKGTAVFDMPGGPVQVNEKEGLEIPPGIRHRIRNEGAIDLEFILCSQPPTVDDRQNTGA